MKNLLFDLFTPHHFIGGAGEYIRKVFFSLIDVTKNRSTDINIIALMDSTQGFDNYPDLSPSHLKQIGISFVDIKGTTLKCILKEHKIDAVFIGAAQYWGMSFDISNIKCPVICVVHDVMDEEFATSHINEFLLLDNKFSFYRRQLGNAYKRLTRKQTGTQRMRQVIDLCKNNKRCQVVTVSNYSKNSLIYNFDIDTNRISTFYAPERVSKSSDRVENKQLNEIIASNKKYYLMLSANRYTKNPYKAIKAFKRYSQIVDRNAYLLTIGYPESLYNNHIILPYLSENDLVHVMKNCYALLFPSIFEGFGYPPVEAMKYGKPVLASNVTSIPEVLGDAPIYFSPCYESDIFRALCTLTAENYGRYSEKSLKRYAEIASMQEGDLNKLLELIINC